LDAAMRVARNFDAGSGQVGQACRMPPAGSSSVALPKPRVCARDSLSSVGGRRRSPLLRPWRRGCKRFEAFWWGAGTPRTLLAAKVAEAFARLLLSPTRPRLPQTLTPSGLPLPRERLPARRRQHLLMSTLPGSMLTDPRQMSHCVLVRRPLSTGRRRLSWSARESARVDLRLGGWVGARGYRECQTGASRRARPRTAVLRGTRAGWEAARRGQN
jgi:hypothetical protein